MEELLVWLYLLQLFVLNQSISEEILDIKISQIDFDTEIDTLCFPAGVLTDPTADSQL